MYIKSLVIKNFGPIKENEIEFKKSGINLIRGQNASGKTQIFGALLYILYGKSVIKNNSLIVNIESNVKLITEHDNTIQIFENIYSEGKYHSSFQVNSNKLLGRDNNIISHYHKYSPVFFNDIHMDRIEIEEDDIKFISALLESSPTEHSTWLNIVENYLNQVSKTNKKIVVPSGGAAQFLKLISAVSLHRNLEFKTPLIFDEIFFSYDNNLQELILSILKSYSKINQIIIFDSSSLFDFFNEKNVIANITRDENVFSPIAYNYKIPNILLRKPINEQKNNDFKKEGQLIVQYIQNDILKDEEYRFIEFKEIKGNNPVDSILSLVDQYAVAYLNENTKRAGKIIWGISDKERRVVGVKLTYQQRDELRRSITEKLGKIQPQIPPSVYRIDLLSLYDNNLNIINGLYIVEVNIRPYRSEYLYSTAKGEVFIKTDGGKKKLTALEIQQERKLRK
ncbi:UNVERIFIED_CONTAM: AAA domain-containing protein [Lysinibacillus xylanilyticus]|uniref:RNA-binding domain-containing protein n=1 Tax=Lysinibacillus xylanilyticus TaxID=582475 RepID=UPI0009E5BF18|nr:RNA-binding domain-containing protein [Lysinibacillus xylanilyticus]